MTRVLLISVALVGCTGKLDVSDFSIATSDDVVTVATASWSADEEGSVYVEYGPTEDFGMSSAVTGAGEQFLLGLTSDTEYFARLVSADDPEVFGPTESFVTGSLPNALPTFEQSGSADKDFYMAVTLPTSGDLTIPAIVNSDGEYVWYYQHEDGGDVFRIRLSRDGESVLYNRGSVDDPDEETFIYRVALDGSSVEEISVPLLSHDFIEKPDGTLGAIAKEYRDVEIDGETVSIRGDKIVEISPDGTVSTVWTTWDCFDPTVETHENMALGWTLANALDYDPDEDIYYFGMRNFSSIARVDPSSASCDWVFGDIGATITPASGADRFLHQHQFEVLDDTILVFDNDGDPNTSRLLEYAFDGTTAEVEQVWSYVPDDSLSTFVLGDVHRFDDGDSLATWSISGQIDLISPEGEPVWTLNSYLGFIFGFNTVTDSMYVAE